MSLKIFLFCVYAICSLSAYDVSDFKGGIFSWKPSDGNFYTRILLISSFSGLYEVNVGLDNSESDGDLLVAYADINADS